MTAILPYVALISTIAALISAWVAISIRANRAETERGFEKSIAQIAQTFDQAISVLRLEVADVKTTRLESRGNVDAALSAARLEISNLKTDIANMRNDIGRDRGRDREELREWINGSFMRSKQVESELRAFAVRIESMEERLNK